MKKFYILILFAFMPLLMIACGDDNQLEQPENITFSSGVLLWNDVENAERYQVKINDESMTIVNNFIDGLVEEGTYNIEVIAKAEGYEDSSVGTFTFEIDYDQDATISFTRQNDILTWTEIEDATHYFIVVEDTFEFIRAGENTHDISSINADSLTVQAVFPDGSKTQAFSFSLIN